MNRVIVSMAVCSIMLAALAGCGSEEGPSTEAMDKPGAHSLLNVAVVNYPLAYFTERIGSDAVAVVFPAPSDEDPAFWMPDSAAIEQFQQADLILLNGATYAKWTDKVSLPLSKTVNTSESFSDRYRVIESAVKHSHGPGGEHAHAGTDFNTWLNPLFAVEQARRIKAELTRMRPSDSARFERNFFDLESDLLSLDSTFTQIAAQLGDAPLLASHPVYGYFADCYGLNIRSRVWEPEAMPDEHQWHDLDHELKAQPSKWMIWEGDPDPAIVKKLKERGISGVVFYPCGNTPEQGDYFSVMVDNAERLKAVKP